MQWDWPEEYADFQAMWQAEEEARWEAEHESNISHY